MLFMMSGGSARLVPSLRDLAAEPDNRFGNFFGQSPGPLGRRIHSLRRGGTAPRTLSDIPSAGVQQDANLLNAMDDDISNLSDEDSGDWTDLTPTFGLSGSAPEIAPESLQNKMIADRYEVGELVGEGGFSLVFAGRDIRKQVERPVAIKIPRYPGEPAARVARGGKLNGQLDHHYIAKLFDAGVFEQGKHKVPYMILELVSEARSLTAYCKEVKLPLRQRLEMFIKVCEAVASAHAIGVIHRDLKPSNILVNKAGEPRVIDFDTARELAAGDLGAAAGDGKSHAASAADHGSSGVVGTAVYMSPEQWRCDLPSPASDVFSLGLVLFELASGFGVPEPVTSGPAAGGTPGSLLPKLEKTTQSARRLPRPIRQICHRCLEVNPTDRFADAAVLATAARKATERITARRRMFGLTAAVAVVMLLLAGLIGSSVRQRWLRQAYVEAVGNAAVAFSSPEAAADRDLATLLDITEGRWRAWQGSKTLPSELTLLRALGQGRQIDLAWATTNPVFTGDGTRLAAVGRLGDLVLATSNQPAAPIARLSGTGGRLTALRGGAAQFVVTLDAAGGLERWQLASDSREIRRQQIAELKPESNWLVAVSPAADLLAAASGQTLKIWEAVADAASATWGFTAVPLQQLPMAGAAAVSSVCFGTASAGLLVGLTDGTVLVLDRRTGAERSQFELGGQAAVTLRRSRDGSRLAAFTFGGSLRLLDPDTGEQLEAAVAATPPIHEAMFTDAGRRLLVLSHPDAGAGESTTIRIFDTTVPRQLDFLCDFKVPGLIRQLAIANGRVCFTGVDGSVRIASLGSQ